MITIDCIDMRDMMVDLAAYLMEKNTPAVPVIKNDAIVLDPLGKDTLRVGDVIAHVRAFLAEKDQSGNFIIKTSEEKIMLISTSERKVKKVERNDLGLLICPHCSMATRYEEEMNVHIRVHYLF